MRFINTCLCFFLISSWAQAQDSLLTGILPDSIVISATRYAEPARDVGQRITIWNAADIAQLPVSSFDELLRTAGGIEVFSRAGFGVQSDITMRGGTFNGVLLLIDGIRFNDAQTGHFLSDFPLPLSQIERIEILRGPATVIYGPDALNGVIHVITKGATVSDDQHGLKGGVGSSLGSYGSRHVDGDLVFSSKGWHVGGGVTFQTTDGEAVRDEQGIVSGPRGEVKTDFSRFSNAWYVRSTRGPIDVYGRFAADWRDFNAYHFYTLSALDFSREATRTFWGQLRLQGRISALTQWTLNTVAKGHKDTFDFNPEFPNNEHTSRHFIARAGVRHQLSSSTWLSAGFSTWQRSIDSNNLGEHDDLTLGGYFHARFQPADQLVVYSGARIDHDAAFGSELTPQINARYSLGRVAFRANVGRAVRAPNYVEQYINFTRPPQRDRNYGNPDLEVEKAWSKEVGVDVYQSKELTMHATLFQRSTSNLIDFARLDRAIQIPTLADSVLLAQNISTVNTLGLEIDAHLTQQFGSNLLQLDASFVTLDTDLRETLEGAVFKYAAGHARHFLQTALQWQASRLHIGLQAFWKQRLNDDTYGIVNANLGVPFKVGEQSLHIAIEVRNLFDLAYTEVLDAPMPGRWIFFKAKYGF